MNWKERIVIYHKIDTNKPMIKGTRISVEEIISYLAMGWSVERILEGFGNLTEEDIRACLAAACELLAIQRLIQ